MGWLDFLKPKKTKSPQIKRVEIILEYSRQLTLILDSCADEQSKKTKKIEFLIKVNKEISRNIYFNQSQVKEALEQLALL